MIKKALIAGVCLIALGVSANAQSELRTKTGSVALLRALDTITGLTSDHEVAVGDRAKVARLEVAVDKCLFPQNNPDSDAFAYLRIFDGDAKETKFEGWMIGSSPALNALEHPRYDVWILKCLG